MPRFRDAESDLAVGSGGEGESEIDRRSLQEQLKETNIRKEKLWGEEPKQREMKKRRKKREAATSWFLCFQKFLVESFYGDPATSTSVRQLELSPCI